tara:strand:+ start:637 stop:1275 length:639 start_codon:yes stop_codon:yes gene_type:complete
MGKVARIALPVAAVATGFGMAGMGPMAGMFGSSAGVASAGFAGVTPGASSGGGFFSGIGNWFSTNKSMLGLAAQGVSAASSVMAGVGANELAQQQAAELQRQRAFRQQQIVQEQEEIKDRRRRLVASVTNQLTPGGSKRVAIGDIDALANQSLINVATRGQADLSSFDSDIQSAFLTGRSSLMGGLFKGATTALLGASEFGKSRLPARRTYG